MSDDKKAINLNSFPRYNYNPSSIPHGIIGLEVGGQHRKERVQIKSEDAELIDEHYADGFKITVYDKKRFVKLYENIYPDLVKLTSAGIAVFTYIIRNLREMQEWMTIRNDVFGEWYKNLEGCEKSNTKMICYRGIIDLLNNDIIYIKTGDNAYYININKIFNGKVNQIGWVKEIDKELSKVDGQYNRASYNKKLGWIKGYVPTSEEIEKWT